MNRHLAPYVVLCCLLGVLLFVGGVRYGTYINHENAVTRYMLTMAPTRSASPTVIPTAMPFAVTTPPPNACGISFLLPRDLTADQTASKEASFKNDTNLIQYSCDLESPLFAAARDTTAPTKTLTIAGKSVTARIQTLHAVSAYSFVISNSVTQKPIAVMVDQSLFPLFEQTLRFTR